ncbi:MAG TPA: acyltransferase [Cyanobium sp.]|nr:acyltransferase [Cyanobium sp.]
MSGTPVAAAEAPPPRLRSHAIDLLRALSILWIVGFWHLLGYAPAVDGYKNGLTHRITVVVLGLFVLIAGHLIGRAGIRSGADIVAFYQKRLIRIYPPYLLALLLYALCGLLEAGQFLPAALLVSSFGGDPPGTLWYIAMLVVFYLLAPFLLLLRERLGAGIVAAALLITVSMVLGVLVPQVDPRLFLYFPPFVVGLLVSSRLEPERLPGWALLLVLGLGVGGVLESLRHVGGRLDNDSTGSVLATLVPLALLVLAQRWLPRLHLIAPLMAVSTASYFMYLFHRPIFHWLTPLGETLLPEGPVQQVAWLVGFCLPVIVVVSWLGQRGYDSLVTSLQARGSRTSFSSSR